MQQCPHILSCDFDQARKTLLRPISWSCHACHTSDQIHFCLQCGFAGCGRFIKAHALQHYKSTAHPISLSLTSKGIHCYICDDYCLDVEGDAKKLQTLLISIQNPKTTPTGRAILPDE